MYTYADLIAATVELLVAAAVAWHVRRLAGFGSPRIAWAIVALFVVHALARLSSQQGILLPGDGAVALALDVATLAILGYLFVNVSRIANALAAAFEEANFRASEYDRAFRHYTQVVRHRVMNPLTVVKGSAQTLKTGVAEPRVHGELCDVIVRMAEELERTTLEPERRDARESDLDAVPRVTSGGRQPLRRDAHDVGPGVPVHLFTSGLRKPV